VKNWKKNLYGFTGLYICIGIWTPVMWFISHSMRFYGMGTFDVTRMGWLSILMLSAITVATLLAQLGFTLISKDLSRLERIEE